MLLALGPGRGLAAQTPATVEGRVRDDAGAAVYAATVALLAASDSTSADPRVVRIGETDDLGVYRLEGVPAGAYLLRVSRLGHETHVRPLGVAAGERAFAEIELVRAAVEVEGLVVEASRSRERTTFEEQAGETVRDLSLEELKRIPGVAESDPLRAIEVLPGVVSTSDLSSSFHVRGGSADQNLVLLDGVPLVSPFHLGGFFSVLNADMLARAELRSGGFGAEHGGRVSSVLLVESDPGDGRFGVDAGVSLLASRVAVGGGLGEGALDLLGLREARWRGSLRRSYLDVLLRPVVEFPYHLVDLQGILEGWTPGGDRISVTGYSGRDVLDLSTLENEDFPLRIAWSWGNDALGVRWTRARVGGGSLELAAGGTRYGTRLAFPDFSDTRFTSVTDQLFLRGDLATRPAAGWQVRAGGRLDRLGYDNLASSGGTVFGEGLGSGWLGGSYAQVEWTRPGAWVVEAGARLDLWAPDPGEVELQAAPRLALKRFFAGGRAAGKLALGRYTQFTSSIRDEELPLGLDIWVLSGERAPAVRSDQLQGGLETFPAEDWYVSLEGYHRSFHGVITFNPAEDPNDQLDDILAGRGTSYGADLFLRKDGGRWGGWLSASWLRARRAFPDYLAPRGAAGEVAPEVEYPPVFDRRVDLDLVLRLPLPFGWEGGLRWNVATGTPYTRPLGKYAYFQPRFVDRNGGFSWAGEDNEDGEGFDDWAIALGERNRERYPTYHRLDLSARRTFRKSWGTLTPHLDILNLYDRRNVLFYFYEYDEDPARRSGISMFPFLPTIGLEATFR